VVARYYSPRHRYTRGWRTETKVDGTTSCGSIERRASTRQELRTTIDVAVPSAASHHSDTSGLARTSKNTFCCHHDQTGLFYCRCLAASVLRLFSFVLGFREEGSSICSRDLIMYPYPVTTVHIFSLYTHKHIRHLYLF
jgi:hypothetical protein